MPHGTISTPDDVGVTHIAPIAADPNGFYKRLLVSGLRLSAGPARLGFYKQPEGLTISAVGVGCTGYLLGTDNMEAPETDLFLFLRKELSEGQGVNIFGRYAPDPEKIIRSRSYFRRVNGVIMCAEDRVLFLPDGSSEVLRNRSDIAHGNVVPLRKDDGDLDPDF